ncbi:MAG: hypothetical protein MUE97_08040 [Phycisphaerales bacterium]|jgi:hypothetical protein|nr:hypothetical protein [Phycisphaerales bacterium]
MSQPSSATVSRVIVAAALAACAFLGACRSAPQALDGPQFPATPQARNIDVQVLRDRTDITFTNTTNQPLQGRLWANQWWSRTLDAPIAPGQRVTLDLRTFKDRFGAPFAAGGFFATENPDKLVQMHLQTDTELVGLITILPTE